MIHGDFATVIEALTLMVRVLDIAFRIWKARASRRSNCGDDRSRVAEPGPEKPGATEPAPH
jgi:hypothetical protein